MTTLSDLVQAREQASKTVFPDSTYIVLRYDGVRFSKYTAGLDAPEDAQFIKDMDAATLALAKDFGAVGAYVTSDEVSIILRKPSPNSEHIYGGSVVKLCSIGAGILSAHLTRLRPDSPPAFFDGRGIATDSDDEVRQYLLSRQRSSFKNAVGMAFDTLMEDGKRRSRGVNTDERLRLLEEAGFRFEDTVTRGFSHGRIVAVQVREEAVHYVNSRTGEEKTIQAQRKHKVVVSAPHVPSEHEVEEFTVGKFFTLGPNVQFTTDSTASSDSI